MSLGRTLPAGFRRPKLPTLFGRAIMPHTTMSAATAIAAKIHHPMPCFGVIGLFLIGHREDGPPFAISREELRRATARNFEMKSLELLDWMGPDGDHAARGVFRRL